MLTLAVTLVAAVLVWPPGWPSSALLWWQQDRMIFPGWGFAAVEASGIEHPATSGWS